MKRNITVVIGTRPEAIKMAPVLWAMARRGGDLVSRVLITGQHDRLLRESLDELAIVPDRNMELMEHGQTLPRLTGRILEAMGEELAGNRPSMVMVQGDTISACGAALAAFLLKIPVAHVEAGLRTGRLESPFPEEGSRQVISRLASLNFAPTARAVSRLRAENIHPETIHLTGNTVVDALLEIARREPSALPRPDGPFVLLTAHRRENFGAPIERIFGAVDDLTRKYSDLRVVYPVHPNADVSGPALRWFTNHPQVDLVDPLPYGRLVRLLRVVDLVLTDSGGLQEEAPVFGKPVLVLREATERPEAVEAGTARLVGTDRSAIVESVSTLIENRTVYDSMSRATSPFGDGGASARIIAHVEKFLGLEPAHPRSHDLLSPLNVQPNRDLVVD